MITRDELSALGRSLAQSTKAYVADSFATLGARLQALEERIASVKDGAPGADGHDGIDGKQGDPGKDAPDPDINLIAEKAAALIPVPKDGADGHDGADGKDAPVPDLQVIAEKAAALVPPGKDGRDGQDADAEVIATKVLASLSAQVSALVNVEVTKAIAALPKPKDGADGVGVAGALLDASGQLVVTLSNGTVQTLGRVVGEKGERGTDGKDGLDGLGFEDLKVHGDGERTVSFVFAKGEQVKSFDVSFPVQIHRGVFDATKMYERGDCVTWGGSTWQAMRSTSGVKPGDGSVDKTGWVLVTKAGRPGAAGTPGANGKDGRDGKDLMPKW